MSDRAHVLRVRDGEEATRDLLAPGVGIFTPAVAKGQLVSPGLLLGTLEVLGVQEQLLVPDRVLGRVSKHAAEGSSRVPVQYGDVLATIAAASVAGATGGLVEPSPKQQGALSFVAPMSGRFYSRPSPNEPPFIGEGDTIRKGQTIGLLEVMKTFNRLVYQGDALPEEASVESVVPGDGDDVARGDVILTLTER
jgi:acetyl-CoA carboxylase biotin carboxyl carrier protein